MTGTIFCAGNQAVQEARFAGQLGAQGLGPGPPGLGAPATRAAWAWTPKLSVSEVGKGVGDG